MSQIRRRSELVQVTDTVQLKALFKDGSGSPVDLDTFPTITLSDPSGLVVLGPTSAGVYHIEIGRYGFDYTVGINGPIGVWTDVWKGVVNGFPVEAGFTFIVDNTQMPAINQDGYYALGDDVGFNYSQTAIFNINKLLKGLRARLKSSGKSKKVDANGNVTYISCDIFATDILTTFLAMALSDFNQTPYITYFTFDDTNIVDQFFDILIKGATTYALASQALIEKGREFSISDNSIQFNPPSVADMLNTQYSTVLNQYWDQLKYIKNSLRPSPKGMGTLTINAVNPNFSRLRHVRSRRFY